VISAVTAGLREPCASSGVNAHSTLPMTQCRPLRFRAELADLCLLFRHEIDPVNYVLVARKVSDGSSPNIFR